MSQLRTILLVEDNPDDYEATVRSMRKNHLLNPVKWCQSGQDALDYLTCQGQYQSAENAVPPLLVLLDLNMPGVDGRELLKIRSRSDSLKTIPVIVLTTSSFDKDVLECYRLGACSYIQKPVSFEGLTQVLKIVKDYWFGIAILPPQDNVDAQQ